MIRQEWPRKSHDHESSSGVCFMSPASIDDSSTILLAIARWAGGAWNFAK